MAEGQERFFRILSAVKKGKYPFAVPLRDRATACFAYSQGGKAPRVWFDFF